VPASKPFFEAALKVPREGSGFSAVMWARSRLSMTVLLFFGLRACEAALFSLNDLQRIRDGQLDELDIAERKTGRFRKVMVPAGLVEVLRVELSWDLRTLLSAAPVGDRRLGASVKGATRGRLKSTRDWVRSLNRYLKYVCDKLGQNPRITTHCFRVNFITSLLNCPDKFPVPVVRKLMGHRAYTTTERYFRYYPDRDLSTKIDEALSTSTQVKSRVVSL
jgi:integrase